MKRRILLVDDEIAVLLTLKAVLEISGFDVDTATSGLEGRHKLRAKPYDMVITDMRMEHEQAGRDVVGYARGLPNPPAIALLTAFPVADDDWQEMGADKMLVKPMQTRTLLEQIEALLEKHLARTGASASTPAKAGKKAAKKVAAKKAGKKAAKKAVKPVAPAKKAAKKTAVKKAAAKAVKKAAGKKAAKKR
ncbi:response regulator [Terriglobus albidus]|uniref:Response regulator n=1 Tax=Terriglobus albidus TaxID=1592106 RepID=A0A5B9EEC7_9BACT|nr:response regulator [Terriglobus albidus]QEE30119.1 response regulator [Terriglobus albidus]